MDRIATLLDKNNAPVRVNGDVACVPMPEPSLRREAHVSGNQVDVLHCPFCGSGGVVARSDGSIECTFCNAAFTVTVSPMYAAFPQSVGGQEYPWPGRPGDPAMMGGDPNAAGGDGYGGGLIPGGGDGDPDGDGDTDSDGPPWADSDDEADSSSDGDDDDGSDEKDEAEVGGKKKPPFGKKSSVMAPHRSDAFTRGDLASFGSRDPMIYSTATGGRLPEREYMRHLAIATSADPNAMAARIREERRA